VEGSQLIILFAGSSKSDQMSTIQKALDYLNDYKRRKRSS
ncbi:addiction module protein, partial [Pseudidiomarina aestuarii]